MGIAIEAMIAFFLFLKFLVDWVLDEIHLSCDSSRREINQRGERRALTAMQGGRSIDALVCGEETAMRLFVQRFVQINGAPAVLCGTRLTVAAWRG
ncbi:MAG: hypothetical protein CL912_27930 [Deltaproteobacteria bacterium]|nr:hypothetical protein [Deltaproteobacteria bacterium]